MKEYPGSLATLLESRAKQNGKTVRVVKGVRTVFAPAVEMFLAAPHIMYIDACFTKEAWRVLLACFMDCNHHVQPMAFSYGESEDWVNWMALLDDLKRCGVDSVNDLVIVSDRGNALVSAVNEVFPYCEHISCFAHVERNIQDKWMSTYGAIDEQNVVAIDVLNYMIECTNYACLAIDKNEKEYWLSRVKMKENEYNGGTLVAEDTVSHYISNIEGIYLSSMKNRHLMNRTSNPVESCMAWLCCNLDGSGGARSIGINERYRVMISWVMNCVRRRCNLLKGGKGVLPINSTGKVYCPWAVKTVVKRGHYVECYKEKLIVKRSRRHTSLETKDWDGLMDRVVDEDDSLRKQWFKVYDTAFRKVYKVNMLSRDNPCSCHWTYWQKMPCVHVIRVLHHLHEYWRVWEFVDDVYCVNEIEKCCWRMDDDDDEFIENLWNVKPQKDNKRLKAILANSSLMGKKRKRNDSTGEKSKKTRKQRTK